MRHIFLERKTGTHYRINFKIYTRGHARYSKKTGPCPRCDFFQCWLLSDTLTKTEHLHLGWHRLRLDYVEGRSLTWNSPEAGSCSQLHHDGCSGHSRKRPGPHERSFDKRGDKAGWPPLCRLCSLHLAWWDRACILRPTNSNGFSRRDTGVPFSIPFSAS